MSGIRGLAALVVLELPGARVQYAGRLLADFGLTVIKVEPPDGDPVRRQEPQADHLQAPESSIPFLYYNAGKQSISLDLEAEEGRYLFRRLVKEADVLLDGFLPGYMSQLGLGHEQLAAINPRLVHTAVTPFGQDGPYAHFADTDAICFAMSGLMYITGDPAGPPVVGPASQAYDVAGIHAASGTLMALWERRRSGRGQFLDVAIRDCLATEEHTISTFADKGKSLVRVGSQHLVAVPGAVYPAADGFIYAFANNTMVGSWDRLLEWMGHPPELTADPRLTDTLYRRQVVDQLQPHFCYFFSQRSRADLYQEGQEQHIAISPVYEPSEFLADEHTRARDFVGTVPHRVHGDMPLPGGPYVVNGARCRPDVGAPTLGQHNTDVYGRLLGLGAEELGELRRGGII